MLCLELWGVLVVAGCAGAQDEEHVEQIGNAEENTETAEDTGEAANPGGEATEVAGTADYADAFDNLDGCAVFYSSVDGVYTIYNEEMGDMEVSPDSTFKIISTLIGLDAGIIEDEDSHMEYSGEVYPVSDWNGDLTLEEAFQSSCVWYFRQMIDKAGADRVQAALEELDYGNCDISEWAGSGINPMSELNGFWLESSLKISPKQQVAVLADIFEGRTSYGKENIQILKNLMLTKETENGSIYGKTGSGGNGTAWFVGFTENGTKRTYFAVYLNDSQNAGEITGSKAREIAISIIEDKIQQ